MGRKKVSGFASLISIRFMFCLSAKSYQLPSARESEWTEKLSSLRNRVKADLHAVKKAELIKRFFAHSCREKEGERGVKWSQQAKTSKHSKRTRGGSDMLLLRFAFHVVSIKSIREKISKNENTCARWKDMTGIYGGRCLRYAQCKLTFTSLIIFFCASINWRRNVWLSVFNRRAVLCNCRKQKWLFIGRMSSISTSSLISLYLFRKNS